MYTVTPPGYPEMTVPSLLLTTTGRKSGERYVFPLFYGETGDGYFVVASKGGAPEHPGWYRNLEAHPAVELQVGTRTLKAHARTATGPGVQRMTAQRLMTARCAVMCPACLRGACRWPRRVPRSGPKQARGVSAPVTQTGFAGSSDRPIIISSRHTCTPGIDDRSGSSRERGSPIRLAGRHHGPRDAGHLVGQSHRGQLARPALQKGRQPGRPGLAC